MFLDTLVQNCAKLPEKTAIEFIGDGTVNRVTYAQLEERVMRAAAYLLALGVERGERVAAQLPKSLPFVYFHLAAMRIGAVFLPLNPAYPANELRYFLADSAASIFIADARDDQRINAITDDLPSHRQTAFIDRPQASAGTWLEDYAAPRDFPPPRDPHEVAMMLYTSGTTSRPKGAMITHGNLTANINALHEAWGWREDDVILHVLPIFHVHGLVVALHGALHAGATAVMSARFDASNTLDSLQSGRFSVFMAVPTMHRRLYQLAGDRKIDLSRLRLMTSGSDRLADDLFFGYQRSFKVTLLERYGMTETGMNLSNPLHGERRVGSVGLPLPGVSARVVDPASDHVLPDGQVGELQIAGDHVFAGYWRRPEQTAEAFTADGWLRTGDLAMRGADGYYTLKGRAKDLIITGGLNVYPPEVELVLMEHEAVAACAVIGCPDVEWGERVVAVIVPRAGLKIDPDEICAFCRDQLAGFKAPRQVVVIDSLPRNSLGKVQKAKLREAICG